ncbi:hypothetical protein [Pelagibius marinus]|uniref:hypothetical protein n=1 Tax=Pelagibius marinus TaxID=2762760 RepID=UPI001872FCB1|nr:hypothetical protein [Pelagibius marinus]
MPEYVPPGKRKKASPGAMLDNSVVRLDLFFLAAIFLADQRVNALPEGRQADRIQDLWNEFEEHEITVRLASTASFLRARDDYVLAEVDRQGTDEVRAWAALLRNQECGTLQPDLGHDRVIGLTLREACSKIIHSNEYHFDVVGEPPHAHILPTMYLYGIQNGRKWRTVLDVLRYIEVGITYTDFT